MGKGDKKIASW